MDMTSSFTWIRFPLTPRIFPHMFPYVTHALPRRQSAQLSALCREFTMGFMGYVSGSQPMGVQDLEMSLIRMRDVPI